MEYKKRLQNQTVFLKNIKNSIKIKTIFILFLLLPLIAILISKNIPFVIYADSLQATLVNTVDTSLWSPPSPDPSGLAYWTEKNTLLVSDGEVDEMPPYFTGVNVFETTASGSLLKTYSTTSFSNEPTGVAINSSNGHIFYSDDDKKKVFEVNPGTDNIYGTSDDTVTSFSTLDFGGNDPEGLAYGEGSLFIADGVGTEVYRVSPGLNGVFDGVSPSGDDQVTHFDTSKMNLLDPEGIEYNPDNGTLFIGGGSVKVIVESTTTGNVVNTIDISFLGGKVAGLAYGPGTINPSVKNIYIANRGVDNNNDPYENDGKIYEITLQTVPTNTPTPTPLVTSTPTPTPTPPGDPTTTITKQVSAGTDDAEQYESSGSMALSSSDLEFTMDGSTKQTVGMRFTGLAIPQGAVITDAYLEFTADEQQPDITDLAFYAQAADNPATFTSTNSNISTRPKTINSTNWSNIGVWIIGQKYQTPNLSPVVQETVGRAGWVNGNAMVFIVTGTGHRTTEAYEGSASLSPKLVVTYTTDPNAPTPTLTPTPTAGPTNTPTPTAAPAPISLTPLADASVKANQPGSNFGKSTKLEVDASPIELTYMKFDLGSLSGLTLTSAKLRFRIANSSGSTQVIKNVDDNSWLETTITYNNRRPTLSIITSFPGGSNGTWKEVDVTGAVSAKLGQIFSLAIDSTGSDGLDFYSKENSTNKPQLVITYN